MEQVKNVVNATNEIPVASSEGTIIAYGSLLLMAVGPIFLGALRSVKYHKGKLLRRRTGNSNEMEKLTVKDAAMFPFVASFVLIGLYTMFKVFSKQTINLIIAGYFYFLGVLVLTRLLSPAIIKLIPASFPHTKYHLNFAEVCVETCAPIIDYIFTSRDVVSFALCCIFGLWYLIEKHWIANNLFGIAFSINGVEMLLLNRISTGFILLGGLFIYDVFWVFFTDVMVTVAKSFDAPIKLIFPQDIWENGISATNFAMLGLGDIVIPGIFIALLLRFDKSLNRTNNVYFISTFFAYIFGLGLTIIFMHWFKHAQPALLYLVPLCLIVPLTLALFRGDLDAMLKYEDYPPASTVPVQAENSQTNDEQSVEDEDEGEDEGEAEDEAEAAISESSESTSTSSSVIDNKKK